MCHFKSKPIRVKGEKLTALYKQVYERDRGFCQHCGVWVEPGTPPHHIVFRSQGGSDTLDNLIMLCPECHYAIHHGHGEAA